MDLQPPLSDQVTDERPTQRDQAILNPQRFRHLPLGKSSQDVHDELFTSIEETGYIDKLVIPLNEEINKDPLYQLWHPYDRHDFEFEVIEVILLDFESSDLLIN